MSVSVSMRVYRKCVCGETRHAYVRKEADEEIYRCTNCKRERRVRTWSHTRCPRCARKKVVLILKANGEDHYKCTYTSPKGVRCDFWFFADDGTDAVSQERKLWERANFGEKKESEHA